MFSCCVLTGQGFCFRKPWREVFQMFQVVQRSTRMPLVLYQEVT